MKIGVRQAAALFVGLLYAINPVAYGADVKGRLEGVKKRITQEKAGISKVQRKEKSVLGALEKIDTELDRRNRRLKNISLRETSIIGDLQETEKSLLRVSYSLQERRKLLKKRAEALYKWQRGGSPFILLNGGLTIGDLMRRKHYLELMLAKDQALLGELLSDLDREKGLKDKLAKSRKSLDRERMTLVRAKAAIRKEKDKKRVILNKLRGERKVRIRALKELEQAAGRLQNMMDHIGRQMTEKSAQSFPWEGFGALKGKLDYPIRGKVVGAFGITKHPEFSANLFRKGIDIEAPLGEEIKTVERGKVIFANRFSGYGKMMIVDHGKRYYTVYAHLLELLKQTGNSVAKGEPIALVGDSGSLKGARLYFEIRKDGKPLDPLPWFRKR